MKFHVNIFLFASIFCLCSSRRLNPLENNDQLKLINNRYIAEWQWESWSMKQNLSEKGTASPGPRINAALWKDSNDVNWYLFGGQPIDPESEKIYSDIWKYSTVTKSWERVFPFPQDTKGKHAGKLGGMVSLRVNFFDETDSKQASSYGNNIILCGRSSKKDSTKIKNSIWSNYSRRKTDDSRTIINESKSLAVYGPRTSKSNTVWQIDLKDKLWTGYVCCCDTSTYEKITPSQKNPKFNLGINKNMSNEVQTNVTSTVKTNVTNINIQIDNAEDKVDSEQEHFEVTYYKSKKKKINQNKVKDEVRTGDIHSVLKKVLPGEKAPAPTVGNNSSRVNISETLKNLSTETVLISKNQSEITNIFKNNGVLKNNREPRNFPFANKSSENVNINSTFEELGILTEIEKSSSKLVSKYCPDFKDEGEPVSWCDSKNDIIITADVRASLVVLWFFNLKTSHWSQHLVEVANGTHWPGCSKSAPIRYAGAGEEVYILCSMINDENHNPNSGTLNSTETTKKSAFLHNSTKLVYRINSRKYVLESLGRVKLDRFYQQSDHEAMWKDESNMSIQVIRIGNKDTLMLLVYKDIVDLWILMKNAGSHYYFEPIENVWRGSALKWFTKFNGANYNFHFVTESNNTDTILVMNPRSVPRNEYWPRERGRFIIRILANENLKNHHVEVNPQEQNSTFDLLQSDLNPGVNEDTYSHSYNVKVLIFFGISLAIFAVFGVIIFLKKCVNCPSTVLSDRECHKTPPVIRYSVMRDDLLLPVA